MSEGGRAPRREISADHVAELEERGLDYWWFAVRCAHVESILRRAGARRYLDVGCGPATLTARLSNVLGPEQALGLDATEEALAHARGRGVAVQHADFRAPLALPFTPDAITCLDVLEHLEDPVRLLRHLADAADAAATLVVTVPAMPSLFSKWDELSGHRRRYTRPLLARQLREGGWRPRRVRYLFAYALPPAWLERRVLRRTQRFEFPHVSHRMNALLVWLGRVEHALGSPFPFGTSLIAEAQRR